MTDDRQSDPLVEKLRAAVERIKNLRVEDFEPEPPSDDCQGVHSMVSDDGHHWRCAFCDYKDVT